jgi:hypothetical protein
MFVHHVVLTSFFFAKLYADMELFSRKRCVDVTYLCFIWDYTYCCKYTSHHIKPSTGLNSAANFLVHEFFTTHYFQDGIHPIPGARDALQTLSSFCSLSVVT